MLPAGLEGLGRKTYDDCNATLEFWESVAVGHHGGFLMILANMLDFFHDPVLDFEVCCEVSNHVSQADGDRVVSREVEDEDVAGNLRLGQPEVGTASLCLTMVLSRRRRRRRLVRRADHGTDKVARVGLAFGDQALLLFDGLGDVRLEGTRHLSDKRPVFGKVALQVTRQEIRTQKDDEDRVFEDEREGLW